jgi:hypothetical protein
MARAESARQTETTCLYLIDSDDRKRRGHPLLTLPCELPWIALVTPKDEDSLPCHSRLVYRPDHARI